MVSRNFSAGLGFVWQPGYDNPADGYHVTPGDTGGGTCGGVIEATWAGAVAKGLVTGTLRDATRAQLSIVLRMEFWGAACDALPDGLDFALFNGRMMSGFYPQILQQCLGLTGGSVDGGIGEKTLGLVQGRDAVTLIHALHGAHYAYCKRLPSWPEFQGGWTKRLLAARLTALGLAQIIPAA